MTTHPTSVSGPFNSPRSAWTRSAWGLSGWGLALLAAACMAAGCGGRGRGRDAPRSRAIGENTGATITIDGSDADWPAGERTPLADAEYLYLPLTTDGSAPLQAAPETLQLLLDVDASAGTGSSDPLPDHPSLGGLGVDLLVEFSPRGDAGPTSGVTAFALGNAGERTSIEPDSIGLISLPTHAAEFHELRLRRDLSNVPGLPGAGLQSSGSVSGLWVLRDGAGEIVGWSDPFTVNLPSASAPAPASVEVPAKGEGELRIVSYNVEESAPLSNPGPFSRILTALDPDVILLQEWDQGSAEDLEAWLTAQVPAPAGGPATWHTMKGAAEGVAIASRYPLSPAGTGELDLSAGGMSYPIRFVAALVDTPVGRMGVASVHLKCCGTAGSPEDQRRLAEAEAIHEELLGAFEEAPIRIVAGDLNLVGSGAAMGPLLEGLDVDGSDLDVARALVLGDQVATTWRDAESPFAPGRLDYALVGNAAAEVTRAFILDTQALSSESLSGAGLEAGDSGTSDHLPLVIDISGR